MSDNYFIRVPGYQIADLPEAYAGVVERYDLDDDDNGVLNRHDQGRISGALTALEQQVNVPNPQIDLVHARDDVASLAQVATNSPQLSLESPRQEGTTWRQQVTSMIQQEDLRQLGWPHAREATLEQRVEMLVMLSTPPSSEENKERIYAILDETPFHERAELATWEISPGWRLVNRLNRIRCPEYLERIHEWFTRYTYTRPEISAVERGRLADEFFASPEARRMLFASNPDNSVLPTVYAMGVFHDLNEIQEEDPDLLDYAAVRQDVIDWQFNTHRDDLQTLCSRLANFKVTRDEFIEVLNRLSSEEAAELVTYTQLGDPIHQNQAFWELQPWKPSELLSIYNNQERLLELTAPFTAEVESQEARAEIAKIFGKQIEQLADEMRGWHMTRVYLDQGSDKVGIFKDRDSEILHRQLMAAQPLDDPEKIASIIERFKDWAGREHGLMRRDRAALYSVLCNASLGDSLAESAASILYLEELIGEDPWGVELNQDAE